MNVTGTGVAIAIAVAIALGFMFYGPAVFTTQSAAVDPATIPMDTMDSTASNFPAAGSPAPTDLMINDAKVGTGAAAASGDTVTVNYVGMFADGSVFDASQNHGQPFTFRLGTRSVIEGWDEGIVGMKEGGIRQLAIPADMAYGASGSGPIPPNTPLYFQVELVSVQKAQ